MPTYKGQLNLVKEVISIKSLALNAENPEFRLSLLVYLRNNN